MHGCQRTRREKGANAFVCFDLAEEKHHAVSFYAQIGCLARFLHQAAQDGLRAFHEACASEELRSDDKGAGADVP